LRTEPTRAEESEYQYGSQQAPDPNRAQWPASPEGCEESAAMDDLGTPCQVSNAKSHRSMVAQLLVRDIGEQFLSAHLGSLETERAWEHRELLSALF
jgi:hypothetical protein